MLTSEKLEAIRHLHSLEDQCRLLRILIEERPEPDRSDLIAMTHETGLIGLHSTRLIGIMEKIIGEIPPPNPKKDRR